MRRLLTAALALSLAFPAAATLCTGARAPMFTAKGALAGKPFTVDLRAALRKGPVVLYFFPAAFTSGCNAEAHAFAEAMPDFQKAGATVIGMTAGNVERVVEFSSDTRYCSGKFAVAAASPQVIKAYDVRLTKPDGTVSNITSRTSYVIAPNGRVLLVHSDMSPADHIRLTLAEVQKYRKAHPRRG